MKLGTEVDLGPRPHCVRWGPSFPSHKGAQPPIFGHVCCGQTAGCIKMALGMEVGLGPGHIVLDGEAAPPPKKTGYTAPNFRPMSIVAKRQTDGWIKMPLGTEIGLGPGDIVLDGGPSSP